MNLSHYGVHVDLAHVINTFIGNLVGFAHLFSAEFVLSSWRGIQSNVKWEQNKVLSGANKLDPDWWEDVIPLLNACSFSKNQAQHTSKSDVSLIFTTPFISAETENIIDVNSGAFFHCLLKKQHCRETCFKLKNWAWEILLLHVLCQFSRHRVLTALVSNLPKRKWVLWRRAKKYFLNSARLVTKCFALEKIIWKFYIFVCFVMGLYMRREEDTTASRLKNQAQENGRGLRNIVQEMLHSKIRIAFAGDWLTSETCAHLKLKTGNRSTRTQIWTFCFILEKRV